MFRNIDEWLRDIHPRIIYKNIQPLDSFDCGTHLSCVDDVTHADLRASSSYRNAFGDLFQIFACPAEENDFGPCICQRNSGLRANAAPGTGDKGDTTVDSK